MWLLVFIPALAGIWRYRFWAYWKWVLVMFGWQTLADFLFAASGTLEQPQGDGLITALVRRATSDGAEVALLGLGFWIVFLLGVGFIIFRLRAAAKNPPPHAQDASRVPLVRRIGETGGFTAALAALMFGPAVLALSQRPAAASPHPTSLEEEVAAAAAELNRGTPQQIDPSTRLVTVRAQGRTLIYDYELSERGTADQMRAFFERNSLGKVCADPVMRAEMRRGVTFRYSYSLVELDAPVAIDVSESVCADEGNRAD